VLAGTVRLIEFALTVLIGSAIYALCGAAEGFEWHYAAAILTVGLMSMLALQVADVLPGAGLPRPREAYMRLASAWSVVFLIAISLSFFAKAGDEFSRVWLGSFYAVGLATLIDFGACFSCWCGAGPSRAGSIVEPSWSAPTRVARA